MASLLFNHFFSPDCCSRMQSMRVAGGFWKNWTLLLLKEYHCFSPCCQCSALLSLGLIVHGIIEMTDTAPLPSCFQHKLIYGLYIVPIITSFFSVLGMAIERFQAFALYRDRRRLTRKFSIAWFMSSWTLGTTV